MISAIDYLRELYQTIHPQHVVEIGADTPMRIISYTSDLVRTFSVVDFKSANDFKGGWWDMHERMLDIELRRVDGDARSLSQLVTNVDVLYAHCVPFSADEHGQDCQNSYEVEREVLRAAVAVAPHVVWFTPQDEVSAASLATIAAERHLQLAHSQVTYLDGKISDPVLEAYHLS